MLETTHDLKLTIAERRLGVSKLSVELARAKAVQTEALSIPSSPKSAPILQAPRKSWETLSKNLVMTELTGVANQKSAIDHAEVGHLRRHHPG